MRSLRTYLVSLLATVACVDEQDVELPDIVWSGDNLDFSGRLDGVCAGTLPYMDAVVARMRPALSSPESHRVWFVRHEVEVDGDLPLAGFCEGGDSPGLLACTTSDAIVHSKVAPQEHELVHAVDASEGFAHPFLEEGVAELFGDDGAYAAVRRDPTGNVEEAFGSAAHGHLPSGSYAIAGHFSAFVAKEFGRGTLVRVLRGIEPGDNYRSFFGALTEETGWTQEQILARYAEEPACRQSDYRTPFYVCEDEALALKGDLQATGVELNAEMDCSANGVLGPREDEVWRYHTIEIPEDGDYCFLATSTPSAKDWVEFQSCSVGCGDEPRRFPIVDASIEDPVGDVPFPSKIQLQAGKHVIRVTRAVGDGGVVHIELSGPGCIF